MLFFLYFFIFSCFSKAREAVKRTSEMKFSYIELTLINNGQIKFMRPHLPHPPRWLFHTFR